uniref:Parathyroid hormone 1 receptor n=1 Tax=Eptatretus burgeri TaxID=7764 RepID=A0A8C4WZV2_EPTBU
MTWDSLCASLLFLSVVCGLYTGAAGQVDNGNVITKDEQIFLVVQAGLHCESAIQAKLNHSFGHVMRWCSENGAWMVSPGRNQTLADYSKCIKGMPDSREMGMYRRLSIIYTVGYSTSIISDTFALFLLTYFRRLHCTRNYIHMHLFVSFILRGGSILVRDAILELEITGGLKPDIKNEGTSKLVALPESPNFLQLIACEISVFLYLYFLATNYFWMLVEGLYLHSLIFLTFYSRRQCFLWFFTLIGWGVPLMFMSAWAAVRGTLADSRLHRCWDMRTDKAYEWIYEVPILLSIVVNFVLLANIVRVIATKLRQNNTSHRNTSQQNWKLIKSTLALMVLFGTHYVVFLGFEHEEKTMLWKIWMHYELFFSSFQVRLLHSLPSEHLLSPIVLLVTLV